MAQARLLLAVLVALVSQVLLCGADEVVTTRTPNYGVVNASWVVEGNATPTATLALTMASSALGSLPLGVGRTQLTAVADVLQLPSSARAPAIFNHAELDFNPIGHGPTHGSDGYGVPHFDVHFFTLSPAARDAIQYAQASGPEGNSSAGVLTPFLERPPTELMPAEMVLDPASAVPRQGIHWVTQAEYAAIYGPSQHGNAFGHWSGLSFMVGSYAGNISFLEVMVSLDYLLEMAQKGHAMAAGSQLVVEGQVPQPPGGAAAVAKQWGSPGAWPVSFFVAFQSLSNTTASTYTFGWRFPAPPPSEVDTNTSTP
jgi:hypothetical protein